MKFRVTNGIQTVPCLINLSTQEEHPKPVVTHFANEINDHLSTISSGEGYIISGA